MPPKTEVGKKRVGGRTERVLTGREIALRAQYESAKSHLAQIRRDNQTVYTDSHHEFMKLSKFLSGRDHDENANIMDDLLRLAQSFYALAGKLESEQCEDAIETIRAHWQAQSGGKLVLNRKGSAKTISEGSMGRNMLKTTLVKKRVGGRTERVLTEREIALRSQYEIASSHVYQIIVNHNGSSEYSLNVFDKVERLMDGRRDEVNLVDDLLRVAQLYDKLGEDLESEQFEDAIETIREYWQAQSGGTLLRNRPKRKGSAKAASNGSKVQNKPKPSK